MDTEVGTPAAQAAAAPIAAPSSSSPSPSSPAPAAAKAPLASSVDPRQYPIREDYAKALLTEKMAAIANRAEEPAEDAGPVVDTESADPVAEGIEAPTEDAAAPVDAEAEPQAASEEPNFEIEPVAPVTPESLSQMVKENAEFGKLLEADPKLKGQLYKTAREAAELKPYREIFADLESAKAAQDNSATWVDVRETFLGSTTREGTLAALAKIAELSYERDENGRRPAREWAAGDRRRLLRICRQCRGIGPGAQKRGCRGAAQGQRVPLAGGAGTG